MSASQKGLFLVLVFALVPVRIVGQAFGDVFSNIVLCLYLINLPVLEGFSENTISKYTVLRWYFAFVILYLFSILIYFASHGFIFLDVLEGSSPLSIPYPGAILRNFEILRVHTDALVAFRYIYMTTLSAQTYSIIFLLFRKDIISVRMELNKSSRSAPYSLMVMFVFVVHVAIYYFMYSPSTFGGRYSVSMLRLMLAGKEFELFVWSSVFIFVGSTISVLSIETILVHYLAERKSDREWGSEKKNRGQDRWE